MARNTALLLLLLTGSLFYPFSLHGQNGNASQPFELSAGAESGSVAPANGASTQEIPSRKNDWVIGIGAIGALYHSSATIGTGGQLIPGATANVSNNLTVMFDVRRHITNYLSLSLMGGIPPKPSITGKGSVVSLGELGQVRYGPAILTADYHLPTVGSFRPYVGGGAAYAIILKEHDAAVSQLKVNNNWGSVVEGGAERDLNRTVALFVDVKEVWLSVDAHGSLAGVVPVAAHVKLNPTIVSVGMRFHLHF